MKTIFKHQSIATFLAMVALSSFFLVSGCAVTQLIPTTYEDPGAQPTITYKFDYTPKEGKKLKEELTFILITPRFNLNYPERYVQQRYLVSAQKADIEQILKSFSSSMADDFKEMMIARGFRLISLVKEQAAATYIQREQSNFSITAKIDVDIIEDLTSSKDASYNTFTKTWSAGMGAGDFRIKPRITLEASEPLTWQLFWFKSVEIDEHRQPYTYKWNYTEGMQGIKIGGDTRAQILAAVLQNSYTEILDRLWSYIDPDEFAMLNKKAQEIRGKFLK